MRLIICLSFLFTLSSGIFASASSTDAQQQVDFAPAVFPNYFQHLPKDAALKLIDKSIASVLNRLEISYIDPVRTTKADGSPNILNIGFFTELEAMIQRADPGAKVYISGGVVRSILGYIYKKMYHEHQRALVDAVNRADIDMKTLVYNTFDRIIDGRSRKEEPIMFHGHYISQLPAKDLEMLTALGIGSDLDILVKFSGDFKGDKYGIMNKATDFINSAETALGLRDDKSALKKSIVPIGDVKDYDKQVGSDRSDRNAVTQGGSSLDWLAFPVTQASGSAMIMPSGYSNIMHHFINGKLDYIKPDATVPNTQNTASDKQTIRGLRALLEIPFLTYTSEGMAVIKAELEDLIKKDQLVPQAEEQVTKMIRNARFEGAKNRFASSIEGLPADSIEVLVQQLRAKHASVKIPEFMVKNDLALRRGIDKGNLAKAGVLMPVDDFIENHTDNGVLYHGTPDFTNVLNMIRNGMVLSTKDQGVAAFGRGVYTDKSRHKPETYAEDTGVVLQLHVQRNGLRVLNWEDEGVRETILNLLPKTDKDKKLDFIFETLSNDYDIDIIINSYPLIQNAAAIKLPKKSSDITKLKIQQAENSLKAHLKNEGEIITKKQITQWFNFLHPKGKFAQFAGVLGIHIEEQARVGIDDMLIAYLKQDNPDPDAVYNMVLSYDKDDWKTEKEKEIYNASFEVYKNYILINGNMTTVSNELVKAIIELKKAGFEIPAVHLTDLIPVLAETDNHMKQIVQAIIELKKAGFDIPAYTLKDLIPVLAKTDNNLQQIPHAIIELKKAGFDISSFELHHLIPVLAKTDNNLQQIPHAIIELKKAGFDIAPASLQNWISYLAKGGYNLQQIIQGMIKLKKENFDIASASLPPLIPVLGTQPINDKMLEDLRTLKKEVIDIPVYFLPSLIPVLGTHPINEKMLEDLCTLKKEVIDIPFYFLPSLIPVLETHPINDKMLEDLRALKGADVNISEFNLQSLIPVLEKHPIRDKMLADIRTIKKADVNISEFNLQSLITILAHDTENYFVGSVIKIKNHLKSNAFILLLETPYWEDICNNIIGEENLNFDNLISFFTHKGVLKLFKETFRNFNTLSDDKTFLVSLMREALKGKHPLKMRDAFNSMYTVMKREKILLSDLTILSFQWETYYKAYKEGATDAELAKLLVKESK